VEENARIAENLEPRTKREDYELEHKTQKTHSAKTTTRQKRNTKNTNLEHQQKT